MLSNGRWSDASIAEKLMQCEGYWSVMCVWCHRWLYVSGVLFTETTRMWWWSAVAACTSEWSRITLCSTYGKSYCGCGYPDSRYTDSRYTDTHVLYYFSHFEIMQQNFKSQRSNCFLPMNSFLHRCQRHCCQRQRRSHTRVILSSHSLHYSHSDKWIVHLICSNTVILYIDHEAVSKQTAKTVWVASLTRAESGIVYMDTL